MATISPQQLRAARALLGLNRDEFAQKCGVHADTLANFEAGKTRLQKATQQAVLDALDPTIEFISDRGVALRNDLVTIFEGENFYARFLDDVRVKMRGTGGEVLFTNVDDTRSNDETVAANWRIRNDGIRCRYICMEDPVRIDYPREDYRCVPKTYFKNGVFIIFGDYLAAIVKDSSVFVLRNSDVAEGLVNLFNIIWSTHKMPEVKNVSED